MTPSEDPRLDGATPQPDATPVPRGGPPRGHRLGKAALAIPLRAVAGFGRGQAAPRDGVLPQPLDAERGDLATPAGHVATYTAGPDARPARERPPLLLVHSINAAGSAYEVGPIFDRFRAHRTVYALDLPGYGFSDRVRRLYTPRVMTDAILAAAEAIQARHGGPVDALALSLSSEFLARAASERPAAFRSLALISPTGFDSRGPFYGSPGSTRGMPALYKGFTFGLWRRPFFQLLTSRISIRYFLEKTWGSKAIDEGLLDFDMLTTSQPDAEHAPYSFIAGYLFSDDISRVYTSLTLPVWLVHGVRGDFVDYSGKRLVEGRPNWTIEIMQTGALPHFEQPEAFESRYEAFLAGSDTGESRLGARVTP